MTEMRNHFLKRRWFIVAAIVGSILNLINQWEAVIGQVPFHYPKLFLTYIVPYLVSSISAWSMAKAKKV